ncbi:hypothetical protein T03_1049 [Trichinella britovi]|uniref:Uncharacterized protein n=1 Tax=Trichinella britovi TaxID=45882 RepID=A0A0V1D3V3_TRIBR|nr:hypothetical protein T09_10872 [Trichinella sp. T9]KRY56052.1 hypothetical protein T03_1049 [Trichinella britovi]
MAYVATLAFVILKEFIVLLYADISDTETAVRTIRGLSVFVVESSAELMSKDEKSEIFRKTLFTWNTKSMHL